MSEPSEEEFEEQLKALNEEREALALTVEMQAKRLFQENLIPSVLSIVNVALHSPNDKLRLQSAMYIVERNLGRIGDPLPDGAADPLEAMLEQLIEANQ